MTTEQQERPQVAVPFEGREIWVQMPTPEQVLVYQRIFDRLSKAPDDTSWTGSLLLEELERLRKIIDSILLHKADVLWLDDRFLDGSVTFQSLAPFFVQVVEAFQSVTEEQGNREQRRAAKKTAARKTTPRKVAK